MRTSEVQGIEIRTARDRLFKFLSEPGNLPKWARAFKSADRQRARVESPAGTVDIGLRTDVNQAAGTVDWRLEFPDESVALRSRA